MVIIVLLECILGFAAGMLLMVLIAFAIASIRTPKGKSDSDISAEDLELLKNYKEIVARLDNGEDVENVFPCIFKEFELIEVKGAKLLKLQGSYGYIKPILLRSFSSNSFVKTATYIAAEELYLEQYDPGPDVYLDYDMSGLKEDLKGLGNCMSHEITSGIEAVSLKMASFCQNRLFQIGCYNLWFSKYILRFSGKNNSQKIISAVLDDIYLRNKDAAVLFAVQLYKEIIKMQKNL